ncbi:MAG: hypothetical protein WDM79_12645 [Terricaulis sp.]
MNSIDRRALLFAFAALLAGCAQGKLSRRVAFTVPDQARETLTESLRAFALRETFKFSVSEIGLDRAYLLTGEDIDISCAPAQPEGDAEAPTSAETPEAPRVSPVRYEAGFYVHTPTGNAPRLEAVVAAFNQAITAVDGVQKISLG